MLKFTKINESDGTYNCNMPKGDTGEIPITICGYELGEGDSIIFSFGKDLETPTITKTVTNFVNNGTTVTLLPEDTEDIAPGLYFYCVKLIKSDNSVDTFIEKSIFELEG